MAQKPHRKQTPQLEPLRLKPVVAFIRAMIAGGVFMGSFSPVHANPALHALPIANGLPDPRLATETTVDNTLTIHQNVPTVTLNWSSFDVGHDAHVKFEQPSQTSVALNYIGHTGDAPSQILGEVSANGQVMLINQNGFVFGAGAVVDTNGFVASTLQPTLEAVDGLTKPGTTQVLTGLANPNNLASDAKVYAAFSADGSSATQTTGFKGTAQASTVGIQIDANAKITSEHAKPILMFAPKITNAGEVKSDGGQVIMAAASDVVYLQEAPIDGKSAQSDVRGLLVEVQTGGQVQNAISGAISANQGNVTLMGFAVNQQGRITASTSINENGSIRLLATQGIKTATNSSQHLQINSTEAGTVTLGAQSTTEILPAVTTVNGVETTVVAAQAIAPSRLEIVGEHVQMQGQLLNGVQTGAKIDVRAGKVDVTATQTPDTPTDAPTVQAVSNNSSLEIDKGVSITVAGLDATASMASNVLSVKLQSNQLADSPLQKSGILFGQSVQIDTRAAGGLGTPLANISAAQASMTYTLAERLGAGGSINLSSEGSVNVQSQAQLNISGGSTTYLPGIINTTKLISSTGQIVDIGSANPLATYTGIYGQYSTTDAKWQVTQTYNLNNGLNTGHYEAGYVQGANAGSLSILANTVTMNGDLQAHAISGQYQRGVSQQAQGGSLTISNNLSTVVQDIVFMNDPTLNVGTALALSTALPVASGLHKLTLNSYGEIRLPVDATLQLMPNASLSLTAKYIDVAGNIQGAGASVSLNTVFNEQASASNYTHPAGSVTLEQGAKVDLRGGWINDYINQANIINATPLNINGGNFNVHADGNVKLVGGNVIDVSGGGWLQANRTLTAGSAGGISLQATSTLGSGSNLSLGGATLNAYGLKTGGSLTLEANQVYIGGSESAAIDTNPDLQALWLPAGFFSNGGFSKFSVTSDINGLNVADGAAINLVQANKQLGGSYLTADNAANISAFAGITTLPDNLIQPSSLTLAANHSVGVNAGSGLKVAGNSSITAANSSNIILSSDSSLIFDGGITDHNGAVSMKIVLPPSNIDTGYVASQGLWLGSDAKINVSGDFVQQPNNFGLVQGSVLSGGSVNLIANRGFVASLSGSEINVSGTQAVLNLPVQTSANNIAYPAKTVGSNGGAVTITAAEGIYLDGVMHAQGGNAAGTLGGALSVSLQGGQGANAAQPILTVVQNTLATYFNNPGDSQPAALDGRGFIAANQVADAGFASLNLQSKGNSPTGVTALGEILFQGNVNQNQGNISLNLANALTLDAPVIAWDSSKQAVGSVNLSAATVTIGTSYMNPELLAALPVPVDGKGQFNVSAGVLNTQGVQQAGMIILQGAASTKGFGAVTLQASQDIRLQGLLSKIPFNTQTDSFQGMFETSAELSLTADRIYPTTLSQFTLAASGPNGIVNFNANNTATPTPVLEADAALTVTAATINQNGNILAPFGSLNFQAANQINFGANSRTSVSGQGRIIPFGITSAGKDWLYPLNDSYNNVGLNLTVGGTQAVGATPVPQKQITLNALKVTADKTAVIDLSGGGDLMAQEFVPGAGGGKDVLAAGNAIGSGQTVETVAANISQNSTTLSMQSTAGWVVGYQVTGAGLATNTVITAISGNNVTLSLPTTAQINAGALLTVGGGTSFAVLPGYVGYAPYDPYLTPSADTIAAAGGLTLGEQISIGAGSALAAGAYTLLPAHYALLPGAYLITPQATATVPQGYSSTRLDGAAIVSGYYDTLGTSGQSQIPSAFVVQAGSVALSYSQITQTYGDSFFAQQATAAHNAIPQLAQDAGQLSATVTTALELPTLLSTGVLGSKVDISANKIAVVTGYDGASGVVELLASDLNKDNIGSLFLGGVRTLDSKTHNTVLNVNAQTLAVAGDVTLNKIPELILAANQTLEVKSGAQLISSGGSGIAANTVLETSGDSALLRVADGPQVALNRTLSSGLAGDLIIEQGAKLQAGNSAISGAILLDATGNNSSLQGSILLDSKGALTIGANALNIGNTDHQTGLTGLSIDTQQLKDLGKVANLYLTGRNYIDVYGDVNTPLISNLVLNTPVLAGMSAVGGANVAQINATTLTLTNKAGGGCSAVATGCSGAGNETLTVNAANLILDTTNNSSFTISGFNGVANANNDQVGVTFNVGTAVTGVGAGSYNFNENTVINTPVISAESAANTRINANNYALNISSATAASATAPGAGVGATLAMSAASLTVDSSLLYQGGNVNLSATSGNLELGANALVNVSATQQAAGLNPAAQIAAGEITLTAATQNVVTDSDSQLLLGSTAPGVAAGLLNVNAVNGSASLKGHIQAAGPDNAHGGRLAMDVKTLGAGGFDGLMQALAASTGTAASVGNAFSGQFNLRLRDGDLTVDDRVTAHVINLSADNGAISVNGFLDARGASGGAITLSSDSNVTLNSGANLYASARGAAGNGGTVTISAVSQVAAAVAADASGNPVSFAPGSIAILGGATIDVRGKGDYTQVNCVTLGLCGSLGKVQLLVDRSVDNLGNINNVTMDGNIRMTPLNSGSASFGYDATQTLPVVVGVQVYDLTNSGSDVQNQITDADLVTFNADAAGFMSSLTPSSKYTVVPGIEAITTGGADMTVDPGKAWNLASWRYAYGAQNVPGQLILRSSGSLNVQQNVTDGFTTLSGKGGKLNVTIPVLQSGYSWSYDLVAGADLAAANDTAVLAGAAADLNVNAGTLIRTGTGDININVARDINMSDNSMIYSAGRQDPTNPWGYTKAQVLYNYANYGQYYAEYPIDGGNVSVNTGGNINVNLLSPADKMAFYSDWLVRAGSSSQPTSWGINFAKYNESLGALGGGNVSVSAAGDINNLTIAIPTTGKINPLDYAANSTASNPVYTGVYAAPTVSGGGNLNLSAGGNIAGGAFYVEQGVANIAAGGSLTAGSYNAPLTTGDNVFINPILALGNAQFSVMAGQNIDLATILNPMVTPSASAYGKLFDSLFFTYGANSSVALTALSGNVNLDNNPDSLSGATSIPLVKNGELTTYPGTLTVDALQGNINLLGSFQLFPTASGNLSLYAYNNIDTGSVTDISIQAILSAADPATLPSIASPLQVAYHQGFNSATYSALVDLQSIAAYAQTPIHQFDSNPVLISTSVGNIESQNSLLFALAKQAIVSSGQDIINTGFMIQQDTAASSSLISAGRDIVFNTLRDPITAALSTASNDQLIQVSGPGQFTVVSGRNIDLGSSGGIVSVGNTGVNTHLDSGGANLMVLAGLGGGAINAVGFAQNFLKDNTELTNLVQAYFPGQVVTTDNVLGYYNQLNGAQQASVNMGLLPFVQPVYATYEKQYAEQRAAATLTVDKDRLELNMLAMTESLYPGTTLLAGNNNYHYDSTLGWVANAGTNVDSIIKSIDSNLLTEIQAAFGNNIGSAAPDIGADIQAINNADNSAIGKALISSIFAARPDIQAALRPDKGDLSLFFSTIQTQSGGNINLMTPNGGINAGLSATTIGQKSADQLGIIARGTGDINAFLRDDFKVNLTRVMTLGGGGVVAGSSEGSIDAGKGVALNGAVNQQVSYDIYGNPVVTLLPAVTTSGIRSASPANSDVVAGAIVLFAPRGVIDAGEAGIAGGNLFLDASSFKNTANISSTGVSVGAPTSAPPAGLSAGLSGASGLSASVSKSFESSTDEVGKESAENRAKATNVLGVLSVDVLGFGE